MWFSSRLRNACSRCGASGPGSRASSISVAANWLVSPKCSSFEARSAFEMPPLGIASFYLFERIQPGLGPWALFVPLALLVAGAREFNVLRRQRRRAGANGTARTRQPRA